MSWAADVVLSRMVIGKTKKREGRETATNEKVSQAKRKKKKGMNDTIK